MIEHTFYGYIRNNNTQNEHFSLISKHIPQVYGLFLVQKSHSFEYYQSIVSSFDIYYPLNVSKMSTRNVFIATETLWLNSKSWLIRFLNSKHFFTTKRSPTPVFLTLLELGKKIDTKSVPIPCLWNDYCFFYLFLFF